VIQATETVESHDARLDVLPAALYRSPLAGMVHKNLAHHLGSNCEEMRAILPVRMRLLRQAFVGHAENEISSLQGMVETLPHVCPGQAAEFVIAVGYEPGFRVAVPLPQLGEQTRNGFVARACPLRL
jgi:hypothetical protein